MRGFVVYDYEEEYKNALDVAYDLIQKGNFKFLEDRRKGKITDCPKLIEQFYNGKNLGKLCLDLE